MAFEKKRRGSLSARAPGNDFRSPPVSQPPGNVRKNRFRSPPVSQPPGDGTTASLNKRFRSPPDRQNPPSFNTKNLRRKRNRFGSSLRSRLSPFARG